LAEALGQAWQRATAGAEFSNAAKSLQDLAKPLDAPRQDLNQALHEFNEGSVAPLEHLAIERAQPIASS